MHWVLATRGVLLSAPGMPHAAVCSCLLWPPHTSPARLRVLRAECKGGHAGCILISARILLLPAGHRLGSWLKRW
jgi:hypothetical protein